jgi:hypothetical protein
METILNKKNVFFSKTDKRQEGKTGPVLGVGASGGGGHKERV